MKPTKKITQACWLEVPMDKTLLEQAVRYPEWYPIDEIIEDLESGGAAWYGVTEEYGYRIRIVLEDLREVVQC